MSPSKFRRRAYHGSLAIRRLLCAPYKGHRVFGIGLSRTGTTSLTAALNVLGWRTIHHPMSNRQIWLYDAATDITVSRIYKDLDQRFPYSKFVLTDRDLDSWLTSCERHFATPRASELRQSVYGVDRFDEAQFRKIYQQHIADVDAFFADRPKDLLKLNVCAGEGWEKLCPFLGVAVRTQPFPRTNAGNVPTSVGGAGAQQ